MSDPRTRAEAYLDGLHIISEPGANQTHLIARYVAGEPWNDPELRNLMSLHAQTAQIEAVKLEGVMSGPARDPQHF